MDASGARSTSALGRSVVADALRSVDPVGSQAAQSETNWRTGYAVHFRRLVEAGLGSGDGARMIAAEGLASLHERLRWGARGGDEGPLTSVRSAPAGRDLATSVVRGTAPAEESLSLPFRGGRLRGDDLQRQVDAWVAAGVVEPSVADAVRTLLAHPEWLRLADHTVVVLGAGSEMGPLTSLLRWGATVAGVDLPSAQLWERVLSVARAGAGTLLLPGPDPGAAGAGIDLLEEVPSAADWVAALDGPLVLGNYVYADGATNLRVSAAVDALALRVLDARADTALAFLATPTDVFAVPGTVVDASTAAYAGRSRVGRLVGRPLRAASAGRLLQRNYRSGSDPGLNDSLVTQQGPNYALAKRLQRWRATSARAAGTLVSMNVAPPTRTRSVVKNRALAAAYAGAHRFGVEVFEPATSNTLMAALLVHDLHTGGGPVHAHPWQDEANVAAHGGLWRAAYSPRSALGLAAVLGYGSSRG
jgi:hypothetical protein